MADRSFEVRLDRLFGEAPAFADAEGFALRVEASLERGWTLRRLLIGGLGAAGAVIGATQLLGADVGQKMADLTGRYAPNIEVQWTNVAVSHLLPGGLAVNGEILWMSAVLAAVAIGFGVTRAIREI